MLRPSKRLIRLLLAVAILATGTLAAFLYTFDLDRYRAEIEKELSGRLEMPVHLGEARLTLRHGLAFAFRDIRIGEPKTKNSLTADQLLFIIDILPLLTGDLSFHEAVLETVDLSVELPDHIGKDGILQNQANRLPLPPTISELTIRNGAIHLERPGSADVAPFSISLTGIQGKLTALPLADASRLTFDGSFVTGGDRTTFALSTTLGQEKAPWKNTLRSLRLTLGNFPATAILTPLLPRDSQASVGGNMNLALVADGPPAEGMKIKLETRSEDMAISIPDLYLAPLTPRSAKAEALWTSSQEEEQFESISLDVEGVKLNGSVILRKDDEDRSFEGVLHSPDLSLPHIISLSPDKIGAFAWLKKTLENGKIRLDEARIAGTLQTKQKDFLSFIRKATLSIEDTALSQDEIRLQGISLRADWDNNRLTFSEARGLFLDEPLLLSGNLTRTLKGASSIDLKISHDLPSERAHKLLPLPIAEAASFKGKLPVELHVSGSLNEPILDISADLAPLEAVSKPYLTKSVDIPGRLTIAGHIDNGIKIDHAILSLPNINLRAQGNIPLSEPFEPELFLDLELTDLEKSRSLFPVLAKVDAKGEVLLRSRLKKTKDTVERDGHILLRDAGVHLTKTIGDINRASGKVVFSGNTASFDDLSIHVGSSQLSVDGKIPDISSPALSLHVLGKSVRSNDLIFHNDEAYLRNIDGRLLIDGNGIVFETVKVRLDGGTQAEVKGFLRDFRNPDVQLDIEADYGNIDEVIALWHSNKPKRPKEVHPTKKGKKSFRIRVVSHEGHLGPLKFRNASGLITKPEGVLTISPLSFETDGGTCDAQIAVETSKNPAVLRTSGTIREIDPQQLFINLLKRKGLVSGRLSGEFQIEGPLGKTFTREAVGNATVKVKNGVLQRFEFLSKVFSILNISQILSLNLPDMKKEGMPFERIDASLTLKEGIVNTEDLFIKSNAMNLSLVGDIDIVNKRLDMVLGVKPLRTVDKIITNIPIAGWILAGEEKALITAHFKISGPSDNPSVLPVPITSLSEKVTGIFRRTFGLPAKIVTDIGELFSSEPEETKK